MQDKLQEDTVSADRKERIIFDPDAWKSKDKSGRKTSAITSRQNFDNEKFTRKAKEEQVDESAIQTTGTSAIDNGAPTQSDTISKDKPKKSNNPQIEFVTGTAMPNGSSATAIGSAQATGRKIAEALVKKAITQVKTDKNVGTEEIPFDGPYTKSSDTVTDKSGAKHTPMSRARHLARQAMKKQKVQEGNGAYMAAVAAMPAAAYVGAKLGAKLHDLAIKRAHKQIDASNAKRKATIAAKKVQKEEVELNEKLDLANTKMGDVVKDFQQSDAPQFKGKSKEKRQQMAVAAKLQADRTNEETNMSKTYADFIQQLQEYNAGKDGVYRHKGTYGGSYDSNDDEDDDAPKKPAAPAAKRGRGRPAGSKSGANQKVTTGKSYGGIATHSLNLPNSNR